MSHLNFLWLQIVRWFLARKFKYIYFEIQLGKLGKVSFRMLKLGKLGEVRFGILKFDVLGEVSFEI